MITSSTVSAHHEGPHSEFNEPPYVATTVVLIAVLAFIAAWTMLWKGER